MVDHILRVALALKELNNYEGFKKRIVVLMFLFFLFIESPFFPQECLR